MVIINSNTKSLYHNYNGLWRNKNKATLCMKSLLPMDAPRPKVEHDLSDNTLDNIAVAMMHLPIAKAYASKLEYFPYIHVSNFAIVRNSKHTIMYFLFCLLSCFADHEIDS